MKQQTNQPTNQDLLVAINAFSTAVDKRFDGVDQRLGNVEDRLDGVENRLDGVEEKVDSLGQKVDSLDQRVGHLENQMVTKSYLDDKLADLRSDIMKEVKREDAKIMARI